MDLERTLRQQEQAATDQNQVSRRNDVIKNLEQRARQPQQPGQGKKQQDTRDHRQREPDDSRLVTLFRRQTPRQDRNKYDIIDPKNDLDCRQRSKCNPSLGLSQPFHSNEYPYLTRKDAPCRQRRRSPDDVGNSAAQSASYLSTATTQTPRRLLLFSFCFQARLGVLRVVEAFVPLLSAFLLFRPYINRGRSLIDFTEA